MRVNKRYISIGALIVVLTLLGAGWASAAPTELSFPPTSSGWEKYPRSPILGGTLGTCFDVAVLEDGDLYRMYFSWRPRKSVALVESTDGIHWNKPIIALGPRAETGWEVDINRPVVVKHDGLYHMWYTGQSKGHSSIGYATSTDGKTWKRESTKPVLSADHLWEKVAVMCPHVMWDDSTRQYRMWYSGGEQYEPDAIGYATTADGIHWKKLIDHPVFQADPSHSWEQYKVTACQVVKHEDQYLMFYIGFSDINHARIGLARSPDGITKWERLPSNPIISPSANQWDADACYKPFAIYDSKQSRWMLWYNGRRGGVEQIGLAMHAGEDLGFGNH